MIGLYMALLAVERDYQVVITEQNTRVARLVSDCVFFNKDHASWSEVFFKDKKKRNLKTCALDEEALIIGAEVYQNLKGRCVV